MKLFYYIISITIVLLFFLTAGLFVYSISDNDNTVTSETANVIASSQNPVSQVKNKLTTTNDLASVYPDYGKNISSTSAVYYSDTAGFIDDAPYFPRVDIDEKSNQVVFTNSHKEIVQRIDIKLLNLEDMFGLGDLVGDTIQYHIGTSPVALENPSGIFYFSAANSRDCGASNCHYILYRYSMHTKKLDILKEDLFGEVIGLYLSPDLQNIVWTSESTGGMCSESISMGMVHLTDLTKEIISDPMDPHLGFITNKETKWVDDHTLTFRNQYATEDDCHRGRFTEITWLYDVTTGALKKLKSEQIQSDI